jgi:hypothetical protein
VRRVTPLFPTPPTMTDPATGTAVWLIDAVATMVDQTTGPMSTAVAKFLTGAVEAELQRRYISQGKKVVYVHDWRSCDSYENEARDLLLKWGRASLAHTRQVAIQIPPSASTFVRIAVSTGVSALRLARMPIALVDDVEAFCAELARR